MKTYSLELADGVSKKEVYILKWFSKSLGMIPRSLGYMYGLTVISSWTIEKYNVMKTLFIYSHSFYNNS